MKYFKDLTTFRIGGKIKNFVEVKSEADIKKAVAFAKKNNLKIFILGGGSDILVSDKEFKGLVIKYIGKNIGIKIQGQKALVMAEAGLNWDDLVANTVKKGLQGLECLSGIPGSVGASPIQNIGAYGFELKDTFVSLKAYDLVNNKFVEFDKKACEFGYRESFFKKPDNWQKYLILSVTLALIKNGKPVVRYDSLKNYLAERQIVNPSINDVRNAVLSLRSQKLENPDKVANAGSFFKNPIIDKNTLEDLLKKYPDIPNFAFGNDYKLFAGWLIEKAGWKGKSFKNAAVSSKNALVLVNPEGKATSKEILSLQNKIQRDVFTKFGINLEAEVQLIGFDRKVAILGYGLEGVDAQKYFQNKGSEVTILDQKLDRNYLKNLDKFDLVVRSPGIYRFLPEIIQAEKKGAEITSAIKIFFDNCPAKIIGVTGTKGKGTTSSLIYEILKNAGRDVYLVGNIGKAYLELLPVLKSDSWVIIEMSSFQLIDLTKSPHIAVVLNVTSDHMDWHKSIKEYVSAKKNIVKYQSSFDHAAINVGYEVSKSFAKETKAKVIFFSKNKLEKIYKENLLLRGEHNLENIAAAVTVAKIMGVDGRIVKKTVANFRGLEHRLELVISKGGITFYNDSFATGPQPTIAAIKSFSEPTTIILGGSDKGLDYGQLGKTIAEASNITAVILIGAIANIIKKSIMEAGYKGKLVEMGTSKMGEIVAKAKEITPEGGVVVLSPAAASFDMFPNYKERGKQFKEAVLNLK